MKFSAVTKLTPLISKLLPRYCSSVCTVPGGIKERMIKLIENNPNLCDTVTGTLDVPIGKKLSEFQGDLLWEISELEPDFNRFGKIKPSTRENPNLVCSSDVRTVQECHCDSHNQYLNSLVLYRDLPTRCSCGHWFLLVDEKHYEEEREKKWSTIKNEHENTELLEQFNKLEKELNVLFAEGKMMTADCPGATSLAHNLAVKWKEMKNVYKRIRENMLLD